MDTRVDLFLLKNAKAFIRNSGLASYVPSDIFNRWKNYPMSLCYALRDVDTGIVYSFALLHRLGSDTFGRASRPYVMDFICTPPSFQRKHHASNLLKHIQDRDGTVYVFAESDEHPHFCMMLQKLGFKNARTPDGGQAFLWDNE